MSFPLMQMASRSIAESGPPEYVTPLNRHTCYASETSKYLCSMTGGILLNCQAWHVTFS